MEMQEHLNNFHQYRTIFVTSGVREDLNPPRQHSLRHYIQLIQDFGALNGVCSSICELAHIRAVKKPWHRSSRFRALGQMLLTNQRLDKLSAARSDFEARGMLRAPLIEAVSTALQSDDDFESSDELPELEEDPVVVPTHASNNDTTHDIASDAEDDSDTESSSDSDSGSEDVVTSVASLAKAPCEFLS